MKLSIVIPVYNSEASVRPLFDAISQALDGWNYHVTFVNDASQDGSWQALKTLKQDHDAAVSVLRLKQNVGQHRATCIGFSHCDGDVVITMDDDLQHAPKEITRLVQEWQTSGADVTYGIYHKRKRHSFLRNTFSAFIRHTVNHYATHGKTKGSSFRVLSKSVADCLAQHANEFVFIDEVVHRYADTISFVPIAHAKRTVGKSTYSVVKLLRLFLEILANYYRNRLKRSFIISLLVLTTLALTVPPLFASAEMPGWAIALVTGVLVVPASAFYLFASSVCAYCLFVYRSSVAPYELKRYQ